MTAPCFLSKQYQNRLQNAVSLWERSPDERNSIGFSTRMFVQANLPHMDPGNDLEIWVKRNGKAILTIQQGYRPGPNNQVEKIGYPYGAIPRLVLIYLASEAVKTKNPRIQLGDTLSQFMRRVRIANDGRSIAMLKKQLVRLFSANVRFVYGDKQIVAGANANIADEYVFWWDEKKPHQKSLWTSNVLLNQRFFEEIISHGFPLDLDAVSGLKKSPLALDLYGWLAYRMNTLTGQVRIPWSALHQQVGSSYSDLRNFKKHARHALHLVRTFWPHLNYQDTVGGFVVWPSHTPVPQVGGQFKPIPKLSNTL